MAYNTPDPLFRRLSLQTQTLYARLLDISLTEEAGRFGGGSVVSKQIRGKRYWYIQRQDGPKKIQTYLGPDSPPVLATVERWRHAKQEATARAELVAMARAGGAHVIPAAEARVLERLSFVFRRGGVLVGSHGFAVIGNMLGVRWQDAVVRTEDVDIAHDHRIAVALARDLPPRNIAEELGDAQPRHSVLNPHQAATSFQIRGSSIQVDLLTPLVGRERTRPIAISGIGAAAMPLRFLDYLIEETQPAVVMGGSGTLVNVPNPGRFALHKLIVAARRGASGAYATKSAKDRAQAAALLQLLLTDLPGEVTLAWKALAKRGSAWTNAAIESLNRLPPELKTLAASAGLPRI